MRPYAIALRVLALWSGLSPSAMAHPLPAVPAGATFRAGTSPTLAGIGRDGVIHVGYIPTPGTFAFRNGDGQTVGYSIDLCRRSQ